MAEKRKPRMRRVPVSEAGQARPSEESAPHPVNEPPSCDCARLERHEWHEVESDWSEITFAKIGVSAFFGVPIRFWSNRRKLIKRAEAVGVVPEDPMLLLGPGRVRRPVLLEVEDVDASRRGFHVPGGVVFTRLLPAPWGEMKALMKETKAIARDRYGRDPDTVWVWYLTCQRCSADRNFETLFVAHYQQRPQKAQG